MIEGLGWAFLHALSALSEHTKERPVLRIIPGVPVAIKSYRYRLGPGTISAIWRISESDVVITIGEKDFVLCRGLTRKLWTRPTGFVLSW